MWEIYNFPVVFCMQMTSCCQLYSIHCSFRDISDFQPFRLIQTSELFPFPAFVVPVSQQSCWRLCELQAVSVVYWWTDIWERTKAMIKNVQFIFFSSFFTILILSYFLSSISYFFFFLPCFFSFPLLGVKVWRIRGHSSVYKWETSGRRSWSNWIGLDKPAEQSHIPWGFSSIQ